MSYVVYSKSNCPACSQAKSLLAVKGYAYSEIDVSDDSVKEAFQAQFPGIRTVPLIVFNGQVIGGITALQEHLNNIPQFLTE